MKKILLLVLFLVATAATAASWPTRWSVVGRSSLSNGTMVMTLAPSPLQNLPAKIINATFLFKTASGTVYSDPIFAANADVRIEIQAQTGAAALGGLMTYRTTWMVASADWSGASPAYPFHLRFTPAAGEALVDASSSLDAYVNKVADWNLFGPGSLVFVDLGTCGTACQNAL